MQKRPYSNPDIFPTLMCTNPECDNISSKLYIVEDKIIEALKIWLGGYRIDYDKISADRTDSNIMVHKKSIAALEKELENERLKLTKVYDFLEDSTYTKDTFLNRSKSILKTISTINNNILKHKKEIEREKIINSNKKDIIPKIENVLELYNGLQDNEDKNELLKTILEKVTYNKTTKAIKKNSDPTDFEIVIYPKIAKNWYNQ